jgi:hypothetical protein
LTSLYLTDNQIGDEGISALAHLMTESSLRTLTLSCCPITAKGCQSLAEWIIKPHCQLRALLLGGAAPPWRLWKFKGGFSCATARGARRRNFSRIGFVGSAWLLAPQTVDNQFRHWVTGG